MKILFIHQNFPGQFRHLAPALAGRGHEVCALAWGKQGEAGDWQGVRVTRYASTRGTSKEVHAWLADMETKVIRGEACLAAARRLHAGGFTPDVIVAHPGWGESLFLKTLWPRARLGIYCEFFYAADGADVGFDPEFAPKDALADRCRLELKNLNNLAHFETADAGLSPTQWQASTFPPRFRDRIEVVHDGIDTARLRPHAGAAIQLGTQGGRRLRLTRDDEVITFVNRNLEPYRGFHVFMRALPHILRARPRARVLIVGGTGVSYGSRPDAQVHGAASWREVFVREVRPRIPDEDWARVHFAGHVPYEHFVPMLQVSTVHVYLTYPFVLSWSLLEAMSIGCAIVGSDTAPVREVITDGVTGRLVSFFDPEALAQAVCALVDSPEERARLGAAARERAVAGYDLHSVCLPRQIAWVEGLCQARMEAA
jgi:glycosyltransferase involved in cell wall biosynthesis